MKWGSETFTDSQYSILLQKMLKATVVAENY